ncbi:hypothetical protein B0H65DRAFT_283314 [Neurospora tetraspora]|uniref:Uncharacterized protein n=1 Tax=Neurospora tetraspora TaxID=94610 RepID=A0AAE0J8B8_9PEZI|nr:hypothetical protein B0H65DRAFT_283314 [Neurospora tetraspora]
MMKLFRWNEGLFGCSSVSDACLANPINSTKLKCTISGAVLVMFLVFALVSKFHVPPRSKATKKCKTCETCKTCKSSSAEVAKFRYVRHRHGSKIGLPLRCERRAAVTVLTAAVDCLWTLKGSCRRFVIDKFPSHLFVNLLRYFRSCKLVITPLAGVVIITRR